MSILSNKGRVIPSLDNYANPASGDLLIVQDMARNKTKNITFSQVSETLVGLLQGVPVNFTDTDNKFTGSFKGGFAKFDSYLTALETEPGLLFSVKGTAFSATGFQTITLGGTSTITLNSPTVVVGQILNVGGLLTASGGVAGNLTGNVSGNLTGNVVGNVVGNVTGDVKGDIYDNGGTQKILDNRTNRTALFRGSSSYASRSLSSSHARVADLTYTCVSHTTTADFATLARSASYASQSRSSSYLRYTGIPNGSSSYALRSGLADVATFALSIGNAKTASFLAWVPGQVNGTASYARSASVSRSSSYALSSSYSYSGSYATSASYLPITTISKLLNQTQGAINVRYPLGNITYGNYHYFVNYGRDNVGHLLRHNILTNQVEMIASGASSGLIIGGHISIHNFDYGAGALDHLVMTQNGWIYVLKEPGSATPVMLPPINVSGDFHQHRCLYVNTVPTTYDTSASVLHPTFYVGVSSNASDCTNMYLYKIYWTGAAYTYVLVPNNWSMFTTTIANSTTFRNIVGTTPFNLLTQIYNPIKKRLYYSENSVGLLHIFNISGFVGGANLGEWWNQVNATKLPQLTYEKTIAISIPGSNFWTNAEWESFSLEYNTTTGDEKFLCWNRIGYDNGTGTVGRVAWIES